MAGSILRGALLGLALAACAPAFSQLPLRPGETTRASFEHDGDDRTFELHLPPTREAAAPLIVALHGGGSSGAEMEETTGLSRIADREQAVVVYPDGTGGPHGLARTWNAGDCCGLARWLDKDDLGMVGALIDTLASRLGLDLTRVYLVGYSNGGALAYRLAGEMSERFAAMAVYAASTPTYGGLPTPDFVISAPPTPLSVMIISSASDPWVPYHGEEKWGRAEASQAQIARFFAVAAGCGGRPEPTRAFGDAVVVRRYRRCPRGLGVEQLVLHGWDHEWPSSERIESCRVAGEPLHDFDAGEQIWSFFADKAR